MINVFMAKKVYTILIHTIVLICTIDNNTKRIKYERIRFSFILIFVENMCFFTENMSSALTCFPQYDRIIIPIKNYSGGSFNEEKAQK